MTSDNLEATLIDDSCFSDLFTMQSQFLDDFEFGLEANNIDSLLELFEEREKRNNESISKNKSNNKNIRIKANVTTNQNKEQNNVVLISSPKVSKSSPNSSSEMSNKKRGVSLLAKPKKNSSAKRSLINLNDRDFHSISSVLLQEHDYCISEEKELLYNKLPDYITTMSTIGTNDDQKNSSLNNTFDKIPNYIKGFLNLSDDIEKEVEDFITKEDENILIELNEAYIEVSDVFFDNEIHSEVKSDFENYGEEDLNSNSSIYSSLTSSEESKDINKLNDILSDKQYLSKTEQIDCKNNKFNNENENKPTARRSRSRSAEPRTKKLVNNKTRRRRLSTRSSVGSCSESDSSRSSSCSSCSSCDSFSSRNSNESKVNYKISKNIVRNENNRQQFNRKRSLKDSYCQKDYRNKIKPEFDSKSLNSNRNVNYVKSGRNFVSMNNKRDIEQRKIVYVGKIPDGTTKTDVRQWFGRFGAIKEVSIHLRDFGDNYAFVTFYRRIDAYEAIEHANDDTRHPKFDLSFGGRRQFCKTRYEDLDFAEEDSFGSKCMDFDTLLRSTQAKLNR